MACRWYIINAQSGFEKRVAQSIKDSAAQQGLSNMFEEVCVPSDEVVEVRKGKKVASERKYFPGYVLAKMQMTDATWHIVKSIPKVTGFLGSGSKPQAVPESEVERIFATMTEHANQEVTGTVFEIGEDIKVIDGPFESFTGTVEEVEKEKKRLKVSVSIFGRPTPVDLEFNQVEKIK